MDDEIEIKQEQNLLDVPGEDLQFADFEIDIKYNNLEDSIQSNEYAENIVNGLPNTPSKCARIPTECDAERNLDER